MNRLTLYNVAQSLIANNDLKNLSNLNKVRGLAAIAFEWLLISGAAILFVNFPYPVVYVFVCLVIGTRMYALYSLLHDGIHYLLFPKRQVNDLLTRIFLAWPQFTELESIRKKHLAHHQFLKTPNDPEQAHLNYSEFQFPQTVRKLALTFLKDITGVNFLIYTWLKVMRYFSADNPGEGILRGNEIRQFNRFDIYRFMFYTLILSFVLYMNSFTELFLLWILPYMTVYQTLNRLRLSTEHFHLPGNNPYHTRTVIPGFIESFFLSPYNLGYHTEHHIYPSVPFYRLPQLHKTLMGKEEYRKNAIVNKSYNEVIRFYAK